jgi:succinyl-diaminopimelate desuccinylase
MTAADTILRLVDEQSASILELAADLVGIPSENPPGDVETVFAFAGERLEEFGFTIERLSPAPGRENIIAAVDTGRPGPHVVLNAHLDTFPVGDATAWTKPPLGRTIEQATVYGRGASDMKGGAAALMTVLRLLDHVRDQLVGRVTLTLVCDEETFGPHGARHLLEVRPDLAGDVLLSTEPSTPGVVRFAEKGMAWGECTFRSGGGHGAYPPTEPTAIESAAAFVLSLRRLEEQYRPGPDLVFGGDERLRARHDEAIQAGSTDAIERVVVNAGVIAGGTSVNMRADLCTVAVDVRVPLGLSTAAVIEQVRELAAEHGGDYRVWNQSEPNASDRDHPVFGLLCDHAERVTGTRPLLSCGLGCTDVRLWRARGVPGAVYGPYPTGMAAPDEALTQNELLDVVRVHALTVCDVLARHE